jgi:hypothetical protein
VGGRGRSASETWAPTPLKPLLEKVEKKNTAIPLVHLDLGILYTEGDRKPEALRELMAAEKLEPQDVDVHWRLGQLYRSMGKGTEAMAEFNKASDLNKAHNDENFRRISEANARHGATATPGAGGTKQGDVPAASAPSAPPNQ